MRLNKKIKLNELNNSVSSIVRGKPYFNFALFQEANEENWEEVCIPDIFSKTPLYKGEYRLIIDTWKTQSIFMISKPVSNPKWSDILIVCNDMLKGDNRAMFLEDVKKQGDYIQLVFSN